MHDAGRVMPVTSVGQGTPVLGARGLRFVADGALLIDIETMDLTDPGPTVVLGPNGAGKSLLLRLLHGLIPPSSGAVLRNGQPHRPRPEEDAMVFQRPVVLRRTVAANVDYALKVRGHPRAGRAARVAALLAEADLHDKARQPARTLSGGEQQRLALVRALAGAPRILFLDEPTSSLDPQATQAIEALIAGASQAGTKIVMVTHDLGQARRLASDIVFLHHGKVVEHTPAETFFTQPVSAEARAYAMGGLLL